MKIGDLVKHTKYDWIGIVVSWTKHHPEWRRQPMVQWISDNGYDVKACNKQKLEVIA